MRKIYLSLVYEGKTLASAPMIWSPTYKRSRKKRSRKLRNLKAELKKQKQTIKPLVIN